MELMNLSNIPATTEALQTVYGAEYYEAGHGGAGYEESYGRALSAYWGRELFEESGLNSSGGILDFGAGFGVISAALPDVWCYDSSEVAQRALRNRQRKVVSDLTEIPQRQLKYILSSHSLEHCAEPYKELCRLREIIRKDGSLLLVLPFEKTRVDATLKPDQNRHLYCWTHQTVVNLLDLAGWKATQQRTLYSPYGLQLLRLRLGCSEPLAIRWAHFGSRLRRKRWGLLTLATPK
jgi:hypothetical protein